MTLHSVADLTIQLMLIPGLSGYESRVSAAIAAHLDALGLPHNSDRLGNLRCTIPGDPALPSG
jgi:putative aminopeptidase FrvX